MDSVIGSGTAVWKLWLNDVMCVVPVWPVLMSL